MDYSKLSKIVDDDFQAKATGDNPAFEGISDEPADEFSASERRVNELAVKDFYEVDTYWGDFMMGMLGEGGPHGYVAKPWLDKKFLQSWNIFVQEVNLANAIITSGGSEESYDAYYNHLDSL